MAKAEQIAIEGKTLTDGNNGPVVADPIILLEGGASPPWVRRTKLISQTASRWWTPVTAG
jgi:hypothetical protein